MLGIGQEFEDPPQDGFSCQTKANPQPSSQLLLTKVTPRLTAWLLPNMSLQVSNDLHGMPNLEVLNDEGTGL